MKNLRQILKERTGLDRPILAHIVTFQGKDGIATSPTGYLSNDPNVIGDQLSCIQDFCGEGAGVIALTYGPIVSSFIHGAVMEICRQSNERRMPFAICYDPWTVAAGTTPAAKEQLMIAALKNADTQSMMNSRSYIASINGLAGKLVLDFSLGVDPTVIKAAVPGLNYFEEIADYSWPQIPGPVKNNTKLPCLCIGFNDGTGPNRNMSVWDQTKPARIIPMNAGTYFWGLADDSAEAVSAEFLQLVTWNDFSEGTQVEAFASMLCGPIGG